MLETGGARKRPGPSEGLWVALIRQEADRILSEFDRDGRNVLHLGNAPRFGAVGQIAVGKDNYRNHVFQCDTGGFQGNPEAVTGGSRGKHGNRGFRVAAKKRLEQIRLLGLGRQAGRGAATLNVTNNQGNFGGDGKTKSFCFQSHAGTGSCGNGQGAGVGSTDGRSDGRNLVFRLEGKDTEVLVLRELVKDVGGRGDGIAPQEEMQPGLLGGSDEAHRQRLIPADVPVQAGSQLSRWNLIGDLEGFGGLAIGITGLQRQLVGFHQERFLGEFFPDPPHRGVG